MWDVVVDLRYLIAVLIATYLVLCWLAALTAGRFIRNGKGPRTTWADVNAAAPTDFGRNTIGPTPHPDASESQRLVVAEVDYQCELAAKKGRCVP